MIQSVSLHYHSLPRVLFNYSMANSLGSRPGTSDEYHDPYCEPCEESRERNVRVECFCKNCNQYLCTECHTVHGSLRASKGHLIQTGDDMPKSIADKPPRYDTCDDHPKHLKDEFCCDHGTLICSTCCSSTHSMCDTKSAADTCQYIQKSEVDKLCDVNKAYKSQLLKFLSSVDKHSEKLTEQKIKFPFKRKACQVYEGNCCRQVSSVISLVVW